MSKELLEQIESPDDLKALSLSDLEQLAGEVRAFLIQSLSKTGGHLAPNLGVVELTLALHKVFSTPKDQIVWDVGHQAYVHKILTGRKEQFDGLRQYMGLSGFPKPDESHHDAFATGHSSTSISAALGLAKGRDIRGNKEEVVAVIGDGAMTGGMAFEALNHAGHEGTNLTVILNDNEMSIGENVGALASYLNRLRTDPTYDRVKEDVEWLLKKIPAIGGTVMKSLERVKDSLKYLMVSGVIFEEMGFTYLGPIDGHNLQQLTSALESTKEKNGPVLLHVVTQKGKGYHPAEKFPDKYHGVGAFDLKTGKSQKDPGALPSYSKIFGDTLSGIADRHQNVVAITAAMKDGTGLDQFSKLYPERFFDVGIAEQHAVTFAAGLARKGLKPVVAMYSTFLQRAYDQVYHDVCMQNLPVIFAIDRAGIVGGDGETHQGLYDLSFLRSVPNMTIMAPKDEQELQDMMETAVNMDSPVAIRYPRGSVEGVSLSSEPQMLPLYSGEIIQKGQKLALLAAGKMVSDARKMADIIKETQGFAPTVYNARFIKPIDQEGILKLAKNHDFLCTLEENTLKGGFGSEVLELLNDYALSYKLVHRVGMPDEFIPHGDRDNILKHYGMDHVQLVKTIMKYLRGEQVGLG